MISRIVRFFSNDPYHSILFALPWLLLAVNVNWPFGNGHNCDPWFYWGHCHAFPRLFLSNPCYDGERLSVILPGYLFHHIFAPVTAEVLFHTTFLYLAVYSLYFVLKSTQDRRTALLVATLFACHPFFIGAIAWDYVDGFGIAYYLLAVALLTRAFQGIRPQPWIALAGAAAAACFYANPIWLIPMGFFVFYYSGPAYQNRVHTRYSAFVLDGICFAAGFAGLTLILGTINRVTVGNFWFYGLSLDIASSLNALPEWSNHDYAWLTRAAWLVFPAITFVGVLTFLLRSRFAQGTPVWRSLCSHSGPMGIQALLLMGNFFYCFFALFYLTFVEKHRVLELSYYADVLVPAMFLALGSGILKVPASFTTPRFFTVVILAGIICVLPLWMRLRYVDMLAMLPFAKRHSTLLHYYLLLPLVVGCVALLLLVVVPRSRSVWTVSLLVFCVVGFGLVPEGTDIVWMRCYHGPAFYSRVAQALDVIRMHGNLMKKPPFFWFNAQESSAHDYYAISRSLRAHLNQDVTFPALSPTAPVPPDSLILVLSERREIGGAAEQALQQAGLHGELESQVRIAKKDAAYWLTFLRTRKAPSAVTARR